MELVYLIIILVLLGGCVFFWIDRRKKITHFQSLLVNKDKDSIDRLSKKEEEILEILNEARASEAATIEELNESHRDSIRKKNRQIANMKKFSLNRGEIITNQTLLRIKDTLIKEKIISNNEMMINGNLFIPFIESNYDQVRQIDHIVLLPTNIFIVETKYWKGKVVHGLSKKNAGKLSFLLDELFPGVSEEKDNVFIYSTKVSENKQREVSLSTYDNPVNQVRKTATKLKEFLYEKNSKYNLVRTIVYYGYPKKNKDNFIVDLTSPVNKKGILDTEIITNKEDLLKFFREDLEKEKPKYTAKDLEGIMRIILEFNKSI